MNNFYIIGHRGYGPTHFSDAERVLNIKTPENSLSAFKYALDHGADGIELDLQITADDIPVALHDTNLKKHVRNLPYSFESDFSNLNYESIKAFDIGGGNHIPSLQEVLELTSQYDRKIFINLDVKNLRCVEPILTVLKNFDGITENQFIISSYDWQLLSEFRKQSEHIALVPAIKTAILYGENNVKMPGYIPLTDKYDQKGKEILQKLHDKICFSAIDCTFTDLKPELIDWATSMGVGLQISTGNSRIASSDSDYSALKLLREAVEKNPNIPFVICKVDEPDKVLNTLNSSRLMSKEHYVSIPEYK